MATMVVVANTFLEIAQFAGLMAAVKYYAGELLIIYLRSLVSVSVSCFVSLPLLLSVS